MYFHYYSHYHAFHFLAFDGQVRSGMHSYHPISFSKGNKHSGMKQGHTTVLKGHYENTSWLNLLGKAGWKKTLLGLGLLLLEENEGDSGKAKE